MAPRARPTPISEGHYLFADNADADGYTVTVGAPQGYTVSGPSARTVDVKGEPVTGQDFALVEQACVSGTVTSAGRPLGAVTVTLTPATGPPVSTSTRGDGGYDFTQVPAGDYDVSVTPRAATRWRSPATSPSAPRTCAGWTSISTVRARWAARSSAAAPPSVG